MKLYFEQYVYLFIHAMPLWYAKRYDFSKQMYIFGYYNAFLNKFLPIS